MKQLLLFPLLGVLFLPACQSRMAENAEIHKTDDARSSKHNLADATALNIQLGMAYLNHGDVPRAKKKLLTALALSPKSADANSALAYYFEKTGEKARALQYYRKAYHYAPRDGSQLNNYGAYLCRQGQYKVAESYFLKAAEDLNYMNTANAYENAGLCMAHIPNYSKAQFYFRKALEQDSERKQSLYELAHIAIKQNKDGQALVYFQKYQKLVFSDPLLLKMAMNAAHKVGKSDLEATYKMRLAHTGEKK